MGASEYSDRPVWSLALEVRKPGDTPFSSRDLTEVEQYMGHIEHTFAHAKDDETLCRIAFDWRAENAERALWFGVYLTMSVLGQWRIIKDFRITKIEASSPGTVATWGEPRIAHEVRAMFPHHVRE